MIFSVYILTIFRESSRDRGHFYWKPFNFFDSLIEI